MKKVTLFLVATLFSALSFAALNPYAYGLTSSLNADQTTLTVNYSLNADATSATFVLLDGDKEILSQALSDITKGTYTATVNLDRPDMPLGKKLNWRIDVKGNSVEQPTQESTNYGLYCPHGLAIDTDPESENFGRILVAEAMQGVPASGYVSSGKGAGLYVFNPSFTTDSVVYTGGNDFTRILASNGYQPWRVKISEDGRIFVSSLDLNGVVVWEVSKDLQTWTPVIAGTNDATDHNIYDAAGNFVAGLNCSMDVIGSGEDLKLLLYSTNNKGIAFNQSGYRLDEYALGTATTWTGTPKNILEGGKLGLVHTNVEFIYDGEGGYWFGASRAGNAGQPNLVHINAAGEQDYYTEDASLYGGDGVLVHNGMLFKGKARTSSTVGNFGVWTIGKDADGKVTLTEKWSVVANGIGRNLNEFAVDFAENLYIVGNSGEMIIAYALPYSGSVSTPCASKYEFTINSATQMDKASELNPYAYNLTSTFDNTNKVLTINYTLNANANSVDIVIKDGNIELKRVACNGKTRGSYTEVISLASDNLPFNRELSWEVEVKGTSQSVPTQVSTFYSLYCPHGLAIDKNPESEYFGRILAAEALDAVPATGYISSGQGAGLYVFNPDFSTDGKVFNGGLDFTRKLASKGFQPWRVKISEDGRIFVSSLDLNGVAVWEVSQDLQTWKKFIAGTNNTNDYRIYNSDNVFLAGPNVAMDVQGSGDNLKLLLYSTNKNGIAYNQNGYRLDEYSLTKSMSSFTDVTKIKAITAFNGANITSSTGTKYKYAVAHNLADLIYDGEGGYWFGASRGGNAEQPNLAHVNSQGEQDYYNISNENQGGGGLLIYESSLYGKVLIKGSRTDNGKTTGAFRVYLIGKDASGKPTLTKKWTITSPLGQNHNAFAVDYAENLYIVGNNAEKIVAFALPYDGLVSTPCATKFTFSIEAHTMTTPVNDPAKGSVTGAGVYSPGSSVTITATPAPGYKLLYWSDRSTENPRTITMTKNEAISAYFVKEYTEEPTFKIEKMWENAQVPAATGDGYQAVGWDQKIYMQNKTAGKIQVFSNGTDAAVDYATSNTSGQQIAVDEVGNLIVFNAYFASATPNAIQIYQKGSTTAKAINFTLPNPGRCDFFSASGDIYSAEGGYVYFYCAGKTVINRLKITNGAATAADVTTDVVGEAVYSSPQNTNYVMVDIFGNLVAHARSNAINAINVYTNESKAFTLPSIKMGTLGGCSFELGGKELWAYHAGATNYSSEWNLYNMTDGEFLSDTILYAVDKTNSTNNAANWLNVQVVDENTAYIYQFCPKKAVAMWKVSINRTDLQEFTVTATANNPAMGTVTGEGTYYENATATLTATANAGYRFVNWTKAGVEVSTNATYTFTVTEDVELVANFEALPEIVYELNGGVWNQYGWTSKKDMYDAFVAEWKAYSGSSRSFCSYETQLGIGNSNQGLPTAILTTDPILEFMAQKKWAWLGQFLDALATAQSIEKMPTEGAVQMRFALGNFFGEDNNKVGDSYVDAVDCSGDNASLSAFAPYWGQTFPMPTQPTEEVVLNAPYKEKGYEFDGWYTTSNFSGAEVTVVDENTNGTLYAKWTRNEYTRSGLTSGRYGTICLPYNSNYFEGAIFYEVAWMNTSVSPWQVLVDEVTELEAGKPYIFMARSNNILVACQGDAIASPSNYNGLYGTFTDINDGPAGTAGNVLEDNHMLSNNQIMKCLGNCQLLANRAYFKLGEIPTVEPALVPGRRRVALGVQGGNEATGLDNLTEDGVVSAMEGTYDVLGRKMTEPTNNGFYIVNGKKVVVLK